MLNHDRQTFRTHLCCFSPSIFTRLFFFRTKQDERNKTSA